MFQLFRKIILSPTDRVIRACYKIVHEINQLEPVMKTLSDQELASKTISFRTRLASGESENILLPEAFAVVREASRRVLGMRHFDVQLIGGIVLHRGMIAEMATGEGKTLVATLPVYLNALSGKGVHVVTVNDYLAERDAQWMGAVYTFLGLTVGAIVSSVPFEERKDIYARDIVYGTNNELGFDFLRDNLKSSEDSFVQRAFHYAIIDEVDSILIDEARTPLIISGPVEDSSTLYVQTDKIIPFLKEGEDYEKDEKQDTVILTERGNERVEALLVRYGLLKHGVALYDSHNVTLVHHVNQALRAHVLYQRDIDYLVKDGSVIIIDEFTGRMMEGRRYSDGLHQALEAKEKVKIQLENQTLASITFQNYFRMYPKLSGMTGTGATEAQEFEEIYNLKVVTIPTHKPLVRVDHQDEVYRTQQERDRAVVEQIKECYQKGQPVLVGTTSIESSEALSKKLKKQKIPHAVLNAKHHAKEAQIIAQAGIPGAVTIATNMAGRGTDIQLGGNLDMRIAELKQKIKNTNNLNQAIAQATQEVQRGKENVLLSGGLYVIGTERHESRRIDNQLRGRSGRQGDPGNSKFYISLQDNLMRLFGSNRMDHMLQRLGLKEGEAIIHPWISKAIEKAQKKVEERNFEIRKHLLEYDDVVNGQRKVIFNLRHEILDSQKAFDHAISMRDNVLTKLVSTYIPENLYIEHWDTDSLHEEVLRIFSINLPIAIWIQEEGITASDMLYKIQTLINQRWDSKKDQYSDDFFIIVSQILLQVLDHVWKEHLLQLDYLRRGIGLRAYAQVNPLNEYKREAFLLFESMLQHLSEMATQMLFHLELSGLSYTSSDYPVVARNALCPCGSGKKYKYCHGKVS